MPRFDTLPSEIILHVARFLDALDIVTLQHVNQRFLSLGRDDALWREQCFNRSYFLTSLRRRRELLTSYEPQELQFRDLALALASGNGLGDSRLVEPQGEARDLKARSNERIRILANWDPSYPNEKIDWYSEYIARNAPISTSWMEQPHNRDNNDREYLEVRGMALYTPAGEDDATLAVGPLDDGSVCLWDLKGTQGRQGSIVARSKSGLITTDPANPERDAKRSKVFKDGVVECVSVDHSSKRAYFALQSGLVEVDLETLSVISHEKFPCLITAISEAKNPVPITVGTDRFLYLHDSRARRASGPADSDSDHLDSYDTMFGYVERSNSLDFRALLNPEASPIYTHLSHSKPLSILHLPSSGSECDGNGEIYVAGRFPSILNYDRRYFPKLRGSMHSGARLASMASLPFPFASMEKDLARRGELSTEQVWEFKNRPGKTLIACGEYNSKGSLEMYGLSSTPYPTISSNSAAGKIHDSVMKNRQTSSGSKLLSVSNHGTRIVVSDGGGNLKWLERDGFTEARRWNIAHGSEEAPRGIFGTLGDNYMHPGSGDIVIKLANTNNGREDKRVNEDDLVLWTGDKIGLLSFTTKPGFTADSFEETGNKTPEEARIEIAERTYAETMGRALEANANEVRWMRGLGLAAT
ncbi:F-box domain-containing protein [Drepanopeziza brunnea f. sp. 'multigermtubi' MB_m1]|uniref:F-box domain-containing protein n=1 Tax=Marssonina brunnea f. sp. multigermtubi (strain MB_m1) TaxID=1072389 RepID=K1WZI6_MARBU|nr:F-box domain-containing protein [Drepanopeziza brunnea f. sp. 'multigermtubi' MB_m1]EKD18416.1 F-box domain-containing protein [Drepanopeziza brunnea f. sp. 'multigermtubi' MB_m1]